MLFIPFLLYSVLSCVFIREKVYFWLQTVDKKREFYREWKKPESLWEHYFSIAPFVRISDLVLDIIFTFYFVYIEVRVFLSGFAAKMYKIIPQSNSKWIPHSKFDYILHAILESILSFILFNGSYKYNKSYVEVETKLCTFSC